MKLNPANNDMPFIVPINDERATDSMARFDVFYTGSTFAYAQLGENKTEVRLGDHLVILNEGAIFIDQEPFDQQEAFTVLPVGDVQTITTNKPKKEFTLSALSSSAISLSTNASILVAIDPKTTNYLVTIYANQSPVYLNGEKMTVGTFPWNVSDQLVVEHLLIEIREKQLKLTSFGSDYQLNTYQIVEEAYQSEYPLEFPLFRRSPRIHLKVPKEKVEVDTPRPKETGGKNELMRTIVPPLGMVVLSGATSFLSGGNPIMMLSMGGANLLTTGFSVSSYFTTKKETKEQNEGNDRYYRNYLIQKKEKSLFSNKNKSKH